MKSILLSPFLRKVHIATFVLPVLLFALVIFYGAFFVGEVNTVKAGLSHNVTGFAWSADNDSNNNGVFDSEDKEIGGAGWISFNCVNTNSCATSDYGVNISPTDGLVSGYAWHGWIDSDGSTVGGWITFNQAELGGCPILDSDGECKAKLSGNKLTGWARSCSVFQSGCSGSLRSINETGGWDGWIALDDKNTLDTYDYGVTLNGNNFQGYAWDASSIAGGSVGIGWIDFGGVMVNVGNVIIDFRKNPTTPISSGGSASLSWTTINADTCIGSGGPANWRAGGKPTQSLDSYPTGFDTGPLFTNTIYTLTCSNVFSSADASVNIIINVIPDCRNLNDDDDDGLIDYPSDPGCTDLNDDNEEDLTCGDGICNNEENIFICPEDCGIIIEEF